MTQKTKAPPLGFGVRRIGLKDQMPDCEIYINKDDLYDLKSLVKGRRVADIGCGYGRNRKIVEEQGGEWVGVEPFEGGAHTVTADAEDLPFEDASFDVVIMDAVLEHIPNVSNAFQEVARILKPGGYFVGYVAFMECFHEISYSHLSFKALEHFSKINGMKLMKLSGGTRFGIDYHARVLLYPLPVAFLRPGVAALIRGYNWLKSRIAYLMLRLKRGESHAKAISMADDYYKVECLRQSNGFTYVIQKL
jgi:SAM-dependent methyltransferase